MERPSVLFLVNKTMSCFGLCRFLAILLLTTYRFCILAKCSNPSDCKNYYDAKTTLRFDVVFIFICIHYYRTVTNICDCGRRSFFNVFIRVTRFELCDLGYFLIIFKGLICGGEVTGYHC